jgi:hypothetical protein
MRNWGIGSGLSGVVALSIVMLFGGRPATAQIQLIDQNSSVTIVTNSSAGQNHWVVDGSDVLHQQWFWYRVGNTGGQNSIDTLPALFALSDTDPFTDNHLDTLSALYTGAGFTIQLRLSLQGGAIGSQTSDMAEQIKITNTSSQPLDFHFFQYVDFNLSASADTAFMSNANTVDQFGNGQSVSETVATPASSHHEIAVTPTILNLLGGASPLTLNDANSAGPDDVSWAFEWDATLAPGGTLLISKDKHLIVPEPSAFALIGFAFGVLVLILPRRKR